MRFAQRMGRMTTAASFETLARAKVLESQGRRVVHLGIGEPDFETPAYIRRAAVEAMEAGWTHYTQPPGLPDVRKAIAKAWNEERGIPCDESNVVVTPGAKPILFFAMVALLEPGDEVLIPSPAFPTYASIAGFADARVVPVPLREANGFDLDLGDLAARITPRTRMLILNSPHNPTGAVVARATLEGVAELAKKHDFVVLADEIYGRMLYGVEHVSIASLPGMAERTVVCDGFSKTYAMTGWRLGFGIMPKALAVKMGTLMNNSNSCTTAFIQKAGVVALQGPQDDVVEMMRQFTERRQVIVDGLNAIPGVTCRMPGGAFYAFPNVSRTGIPSQQLADRLLDEAGVVTLAGSGFGDEGEGYLRLSFANSIPELQEGVKRIRDFLAVHAKA